MDDFYRHLFGHASCASRVSVWVKQTKLTEHIGTGNLNAFKEFATEHSAANDVYVGIATRRMGLSPRARGKVEDCLAVSAFFLDVDRRSGAAHAATNLPATDEDLASILSVCPHAPTMIVDSGHGWHVYWCFPPEQNVGTSYFSDASKQWQEPFIAHAKSLGWHVDQTGNVDRVLRVPGTLNHKIPTDPRPVVLLMADGPTYTLDQLADVWSPPPVVLHRPPAPPLSGIFANPPAVEPDGAKAIDVPAGGAALTTPPREPTGRDDATILADLRRAMASVKSAQTKALMAKILAGESFATPGKRDTELNRAAGTIGMLEPHEDPHVLARVFDDSISHWGKEDGAKYSQSDRLKWAADKIKRAQDKKRTLVSGEKTANAGIERALCAAARRSPRGANLPPPPDDLAAPYSDFEVMAFAAQQGAPSPAAFKKRWIIQKGPAYYVYVNGAYKAPLTREELTVAVYADLAPADGGALSLFTLDSKGNRRKKTLPEILGDYSTVARGFISQVGLDVSHYDGLEDCFYESVAPLRGTVYAKFHPQIDYWLRQLGGVKADKLLDWIASVTMLDKQACALFLFGAPGTGKTMLATGLARLWTTGGPTELGRVLGEWSSDLARCPLVFADEQIPNAGPRSRTSADLRALIGSSSRTLTRKYMANVDMTGCIRLMLASNNFEMLMFDETLSQHDLEAVAGRFMFIEADVTAKRYLESIDTEGWVAADMIAEHALWLRANRVVVPGKRFLVEGEESVLTSMLALQGAIPNMVAEWIARALADTGKKTGAVSRGLIKVHNGDFLVSTNALVDFWELYVKNQRQPHTYAIGSALRNLSTRQVRVGGRRYWAVNLETLIPWADAHQIGESEELWAHVAASREDEDAIKAAGMSTNDKLAAAQAAQAQAVIDADVAALAAHVDSLPVKE